VECRDSGTASFDSTTPGQFPRHRADGGLKAYGPPLIPLQHSRDLLTERCVTTERAPEPLVLQSLALSLSGVSCA
jgi:hypothetical protein